MKKQLNKLNLLKWVARIATMPICAFVLFMIGAHVVDPHEGTGELDFEVLAHILLYLGLPVIGLIVAWKWEAVGASIVLISHGAIALERPELLTNPFAIALFVPAILFLVYWVLKNRGQNNINMVSH